MRYEPQIGGRVGISECSQRRGQLHKTCNGAAGGAGYLSVAVQKHVFPVFHEPHVYMQARAGFPFGNFRGKAYLQPVFIGEVADNPFGQHDAVGGLLDVHRQEFDLILFPDLSAGPEVPDFRMAVFYLSSSQHYIVHASGPEAVELCERCGFMVAFLVCCRIHLQVALFRSRYIVFQFPHGLEVHACLFPEDFLRL